MRVLLLDKGRTRSRQNDPKFGELTGLPPPLALLRPDHIVGALVVRRRGCSTSCASGPMICANRCSSRPPQPTSSRSSAARRWSDKALSAAPAGMPAGRLRWAFPTCSWRQLTLKVRFTTFVLHYTTKGVGLNDPKGDREGSSSQLGRGFNAGTVSSSRQEERAEGRMNSKPFNRVRKCGGPSTAFCCSAWRSFSATPACSCSPLP
jgi:hypothetical protein